MDAAKDNDQAYIFYTSFEKKKQIYMELKWSTCSVKEVTTQPNVYIGFFMYNSICVHVCDVNLKGLFIIKQASSVCVKTEVNLGFISRYIACEPDSYWPFHMNGLYIYTGAGHIIRISSKSLFISLIPFKK